MASFLSRSQSEPAGIADGSRVLPLSFSVAAADAAYEKLNRITDKTLTPKYPSLPSKDAVENWDDMREVLSGIARLYLE